MAAKHESFDPDMVLGDPSKPPPSVSKPIAGSEPAPRKMELSLDDMAAIRKEARRKVEAELLAGKRKKFEDEALTEARIEAGIVPATVSSKKLPMRIDVAEFTDRVTIDGVVFLHGRVYMVTEAQRQTLRDIMARTHMHQEEVEGRRKFDGIRRNRVLSGLNVQAEA